MKEQIFLTCPHCNDQVQENAYSLHVTGQYKGKQLYPIGTCYVLQQRRNKID